jgi:hypothetical protein
MVGPGFNSRSRRTYAAIFAQKMAYSFTYISGTSSNLPKRRPTKFLNLDAYRGHTTEFCGRLGGGKSMRKAHLLSFMFPELALPTLSLMPTSLCYFWALVVSMRRSN